MTPRERARQWLASQRINLRDRAQVSEAMAVVRREDRFLAEDIEAHRHNPFALKELMGDAATIQAAYRILLDALRVIRHEEFCALVASRRFAADLRSARAPRRERRQPERVARPRPGHGSPKMSKAPPAGDDDDHHHDLDRGDRALRAGEGSGRVGLDFDAIASIIFADITGIGASR